MACNESSVIASINWDSKAQHQGYHKNTVLGRSLASSEHQVNQCCDLVPRKLTQPEAFCPGAGRRGVLLVPHPERSKHIPGAMWGRLYARPNISGAALTSLHLIGPHNSTRSPPALTRDEPPPTAGKAFRQPVPLSDEPAVPLLLLS